MIGNARARRLDQQPPHTDKPKPQTCINNEVSVCFQGKQLPPLPTLSTSPKAQKNPVIGIMQSTTPTRPTAVHRASVGSTPRYSLCKSTPV